ncbi:ABC transporter permease [Psittacicella hinzii]|uniref:Transport permease protein n=1 Tax=Psittacicella hinzii TaxID=2028575 RepID=A0A3A1YMP7_9GAMM|nr:ABC transporter permease [Psittacicella hinzii]RIY38538.1 hypothetical protein CKF58_04025 [Psittacicella hinzii]
MSGIKLSAKEQQALNSFQEQTYLEASKPRSFWQINKQSILCILLQEYRRNKNEWVDNIFSQIIGAIIYFLVFGTLIGRFVGDIDGIPYINFIVPGFIAMTLIMTAYDQGVWFLYFKKYDQSITSFQTSPISPHAFIIGQAIASFIRCLFVLTCIYLLSWIFTGVTTIAHPFLALSVVLLVSILGANLGVIGGLYANTWEQCFFVSTFIIQPLIYVSGVFYSVDQVPGILSKISQFNPISYIVSSSRYAFYEHAMTWVNPYYTLIILSVLIVITYIWIKILLRKFFNMR